MTAKRGQPRRYKEKKTAHIFADVTPEGKQILDRKIYQYDARLSRSELLEQLGRGTIADIVKFNQIFFGVNILIDNGKPASRNH